MTDETTQAWAPGVHDNIGNAEYHAGPGISNSGLGDILQSPWHYWSRHLDPKRPAREPTLPQEDGTVSHCAILEPDAFADRYVVGPDIRRGTKQWNEFCSIHEGKTVIKPDQYTRAMRQRDAVWRIPEVAKALSKGKAEASAYAIDPETGVLCRCRPDFAHKASSSDILVDVKTYSDARPAEFARQCARMNYHRQAAYYSDVWALASGRKVSGFIFVSVEMPWPHAAAASMLDVESMNSGFIQYRRALNVYARCLEADDWPAYSDNITMMTLPAWAMEDEQ